MRAFLLALALLSVSSAYQKKQKPPDVTVVETKARRAEGRILVDARARATGEKPLRGLVLVFDLMSPENGVVSSEKALLDDDVLQPGDERSCQSATSDVARAVKYKVRAFDTSDRELRVGNDGPFPIE